MVDLPPTIRWRDGRLWFLDQTRLPHEEVVEEQHDVEQVRDSIVRLVVRGAPALGVAGAYGVALGARLAAGAGASDVPALLAAVEADAERLATARPTAVNLRWGAERVRDRARAAAASGRGVAAVVAAATAEAEAVHAEDQACCRAIAEHGAGLVSPGATVLTHCNAGALATSGMGSALAPLYLAHERGVAFRVLADETRPLLQGARLTAWELDRAGVDVTVLGDGAAPGLLARGEVQLVVVGADRVAANGDVANKVGTFGVALAAAHAGVPFYVACPVSTIDLATPDGAAIPIEERDPVELTHLGDAAIAPAGVGARNPAFDVTPHGLVTGIITEVGVLGAPYAASLRRAAEERAAEGRAAEGRAAEGRAAEGGTADA